MYISDYIYIYSQFQAAYPSNDKMTIHEMSIKVCLLKLSSHFFSSYCEIFYKHSVLPEIPLIYDQQERSILTFFHRPFGCAKASLDH